MFGSNKKEETKRISQIDSIIKTSNVTSLTELSRLKILPRTKIELLLKKMITIASNSYPPFAIPFRKKSIAFEISFFT